MTTEQYSIGYDAGYQDGFDAALAEPVKQEPVAWMYALAAKAGFDAELMQINHERGMPSNAEVFGNLVRDFVRAEALEEAAKVCRTAQAQGLQSIREAIEAAIRGLK